MQTIYKKGFTLIELLVVIAIIGILAGIVLASLSSARGGANDAKVKEQLAAMRAQAELYTGGGAARGTGTCSPTAGTVFDTAANGLGTLLIGLNLTGSDCGSALGLPSAGALWAAAVTIGSGASVGAWCVDSAGWSSDKSKTSGGVTAYTSALQANTGTACL